MVLLAPMVVSADAPVTAATQCKMRHDLITGGWSDVGLTCAAKGSPCEFTSTAYTCGSCCVIDVIFTIVDWVFVIVIAISAIMVIWGGYNLIMSAGDPARVATGRNYLLYSIVGVIVAFIAKALPAIIKAVLGA